MPKGGSGFMKAAGRAASAALGGRGGGWSVANRGEAIRAVQKFYAQTYRNDDVTFTYNSRGRISGVDQVSDRFFDRAEKLSERLARDAVVYNEEAERNYRDLQSAVRGIRTSEAERRELRETYQDKIHIRANVGREAPDALTAARQMAERGLIAPNVASEHYTNVDMLAALNDAVNSAKGNIWTSAAKMYGSGAAKDFQADIFTGLIDRYEGVVKNAETRRR